MPITDPREALLFLNEHEAQTIDAIAGRIIPGDGDDPGAREAGATTYVDRALSGFLRELQTFYRRSLARLDEQCVDAHGSPFADLAAELQDGVLAELERAGRAGEGDSEVRAVSWEDANLLPTFFEVVREHILQGTFGDPAYGGNRDLAGWRLIGFPGAHWSYSAEQMARGVDGRLIPLKTLSDLRRTQPWNDGS
jgi:gluconate 2-dehydrogenase gamma chain